MRTVFLLPLLLIGAAQAACADAAFGLGNGDEPDTGTNVDSATADTATLETTTSIDAADTFVDETSADAVDSTIDDVTPSDVIETSTDSVVETPSDTKPSRCSGKGILKDHVVVIFQFYSCCTASPPCCGRDSGYLAYKGSVDSGSTLDPFPGCTAPTAAQNTLACDFGIGKAIRFAVGVSLAPGMKLDHTIAVTGKGTLLACKGDTEIGFCESGSCTGALSPDTDGAFKCAVP